MELLKIVLLYIYINCLQFSSSENILVLYENLRV